MQWKYSVPTNWYSSDEASLDLTAEQNTFLRSHADDSGKWDASEEDKTAFYPATAYLDGQPHGFHDWYTPSGAHSDIPMAFLCQFE